jgi:spore maturation protein CgeB
MIGWPNMELLIIGYGEPGQLGSYLASAAEQLGLNYRTMDARKAETSHRLLQTFFWRVRGRRPANLGRFATQVVNACADMRPAVVITTGGRVPLERAHIEKLRALGCKVVNYSTDDPWNPNLYAKWFVTSLPAYDVIFTPRRANINDFRQSGASDVDFMPFGYDPETHRPSSANVAAAGPSDLLFVGGCDGDRLPLVGSLADAGLSLALYGQYWDRHSKTSPYARGFADQETVRAASAAAAVCLCLVRRANRDGHVMRSFEAAAIGGCILAEDSEDHRNLFGPHGGAVRYFKTIPDLVREARALVADPGERQRMTLQLRERMLQRADTYADRLSAMLRHIQKGNGAVGSANRRKELIPPG